MSTENTEASSPVLPMPKIDTTTIKYTYDHIQRGSRQRAVKMDSLNNCVRVAWDNSLLLNRNTFAYIYPVIVEFGVFIGGMAAESPFMMRLRTLDQNSPLPTAIDRALSRKLFGNKKASITPAELLGTTTRMPTSAELEKALLDANVLCRRRPTLAEVIEANKNVIDFTKKPILTNDQVNDLTKLGSEIPPLPFA